MKKVYCYACHDFIHGIFNYSTLEEIPTNFITLLENRRSKNFPFSFTNEQPKGLLSDIHAKYNQYATLKIQKNKYDADTFCLMNIEICFKYSTGSCNIMRFETMKDAQDYYIYVCSKFTNKKPYEYIHYNDINALCRIGDSIELLSDEYPYFEKGDIIPIIDYGDEYTGMLCPPYKWISTGVIDKNIWQTDKLSISFPVEAIHIKDCKIIRNGEIFKEEKVTNSMELF